MSSTTDRRVDQRGQILPLLAGGLIAILLIAALVFDVARASLDRRTEQNSSDAAALAGARYLTEPACQASPNLANCECGRGSPAIATDNGYTNGRTVRS